MSRKFWSILSFVLVASLLISACGNRTAVRTPQVPVLDTIAPKATKQAGDTDGDVTITIWHQWESANLTAIEEVFRAYEEKNPGIKINLVKPDHMSDQINESTLAGKGPDIIAWGADKIGSQVAERNIVPLDQFDVDMAFMENSFEPGAVKGVIYQDHIWALPESQEGISLVYNKAAASEEDFPTDYLDFSGLLEKAKSYRKSHPDKYLICNQGLGNSDAYQIAPIFFGYGVPAYVDEEGKAYINTPEALAAGNWINQFRDYAPAETSYSICRTMLVQGQTAAWWTGPWDIQSLEADGVKVGILPMGRPFNYVNALMITNNAVNRGQAERALDIIKFFTNTSNSIKLSIANQTIPASTAALKDPGVQALPTVAGYGEALHDSVPMPNTPFASVVWVPVGEASLAIWKGLAVPEVALATAEEAINIAVEGMK